MWTESVNESVLDILRALDDRYAEPQQRLADAVASYWRARAQRHAWPTGIAGTTAELDEQLAAAQLHGRLIDLSDDHICDLLIDLYRFATDYCRRLMRQNAASYGRPAGAGAYRNIAASSTFRSGV
jgi:hypothetical protein